MKKTSHSMRKAAPIKARIDTFTVHKEETLLPFLIEQFPNKVRTVLKTLLRDRHVFINGIAVGQFNHPLAAGALIEVHWAKNHPRKQHDSTGLDIVFEDTDLIVINKPSGLLTVATATEKRKTAYSLLSEYVKREAPENKIFIVHRLDRETSGLLLFAKNNMVKQHIQETWETMIEQRTYVGVVEGIVKKNEGTVSSWLTETSAFNVYSQQNAAAGRKAVTHYRKIGGNSRYSLLQLNLDTGRKHQIRVHMQDIGHPIVGDKKYGVGPSPIHRLALHAQILAFTHPKTGQSLRFETLIPEIFLQVTATSCKRKKN